MAVTFTQEAERGLSPCFCTFIEYVSGAAGAKRCLTARPTVLRTKSAFANSNKSKLP